MIFYFTGTGNSLYAAQSLAAPGENLISIKEAVESRSYTYELQDGEKAGFVFPVYFGGLPTIVIHFVCRLSLAGPAPEYIYVVLTNGGDPMAADRMVRNYMDRKGLPVNDVFSITMPDNYCLLYKMASEEEEARILEDAETQLKSLTPYHSGMKERITTGLIYPLYKKGRKTRKFWVDDQCVGCHACEQRCPAHAIKLIDGKPVWVKDRCVLCLGCMRCGAIHYADADSKNGRYKHPIFRKKH